MTVAAASSTGTTTPTLATLSVSITVQCARFARSESSSPACSINITQTAKLRASGQAPELFFEASLALNKYPWPAGNTSAAVQQSIVVNNGMHSLTLGTLLKRTAAYDALTHLCIISLAVLSKLVSCT